MTYLRKTGRTPEVYETLKKLRRGGWFRGVHGAMQFWEKLLAGEQEASLTHTAILRNNDVPIIETLVKDNEDPLKRRFKVRIATEKADLILAQRQTLEHEQALLTRQCEYYREQIVENEARLVKIDDELEKLGR
jgi:hypothetical protein